MWNLKSKNWAERKNFSFTMWFEKKKCALPRFPSFRFCPILEIPELEIEAGNQLYAIGSLCKCKVEINPYQQKETIKAFLILWIPSVYQRIQQSLKKKESNCCNKYWIFHSCTIKLLLALNLASILAWYS